MAGSDTSTERVFGKLGYWLVEQVAFLSALLQSLSKQKVISDGLQSLCHFTCESENSKLLPPLCRPGR